MGATEADTITGGTMIECMSTCDCPMGTRCTENGCNPSAQIVYCCSAALCPSGVQCEGPQGVSVCP